MFRIHLLGENLPVMHVSQESSWVHTETVFKLVVYFIISQVFLQSCLEFFNVARCTLPTFQPTEKVIVVTTGLLPETRVQHEY